ncbi:MAG: hypothetical protein V3R20_03025, partial [Sphingomonadales bacterium]
TVANGATIVARAAIITGIIIDVIKAIVIIRLFITADIMAAIIEITTAITAMPELMPVLPF